MICTYLPYIQCKNEVIIESHVCPYVIVFHLSKPFVGIRVSLCTTLVFMTAVNVHIAVSLLRYHVA
jgi:hypothetical protein